MPRILHTSDWHLGALFHDVDRGGDEDEALAALTALCAERSVDCVIIAGDIFDTANPGVAETRRWYQAARDLVVRGGVGAVVAIAGNHDSGARLEGPRELMESCRVLVRGVLGADDPPERALATLPGRDGRACLLCAAVPYLREADLHMPGGDAPMAKRQAQAMQARCAAILAAARTQAEAAGLPLVVAAHAYVRGGQNSRSERLLFAEAVGNLGQVEAACLAEGAAYAAFGHLHRPQRVAGRDHWRYSGSLLPTGFDEVDVQRSVVIADIAGDAPAAVETVPLPSRRRYAALRGTRDELAAGIAALPLPAEDEPKPLLMATVLTREAQHGLGAEIAAMAAERRWSALRIVRESIAADQAAAPAPLDIAEIDPLEVFRYAHRSAHGGNEPGAELTAAFRTLLAEVQAGQEQA